MAVQENKGGSLQPIAQLANDSVECNFAQLVSREDGSTIISTFDWTDFFATKKITGIKKYHHFRKNSSSVDVMALTATATRSLQREVVKSLGKIDPIVVTISPDKPNIIFTVSYCTTLEEAFIPLMEHLEAKRMRMDRVLIYCQRQNECAQLYLLFCLRLGENVREPPGDGADAMGTFLSPTP